MGDASGPSRQVSMPSEVSRRVSSVSGATSSLQRDLERVMEETYPGSVLRGVKRPSETSLEPEGTTVARVQQDDAPSNTEDVLHASSLLTFCQDCGEQHRVMEGGVQVCSRCSSTRTVNSPFLVESWFDEVMEREALNKFFSDEPDSATVAPVDKNIDYTANLASKDPTRETSTRGLQRLDVLHRHGRECVWQDGWDGSPSEIQPFFCQTSYLSAAHKFGDHNENAPRTKPSLSEVWAHRLLRANLESLVYLH